MKIQNINSANYSQQNKAPNFKRRLEGEYVRALIKHGIEKPKGMHPVINGIRRILHDGVDGVVRLDFSKYKLENWLFPGTYRINVDGVHKGTNYHFVGGGIGLQGRFALEEVYRDDAGKLIKPTNPSSYEHPKIAEIKERINKTWRAIFDEYDSLDTDYKKIRKLKLSRKFLEKRLVEVTREEFIKLQKLLFPEDAKLKR